MTRHKEMSNIIKQMKPMLSRIWELTDDELEELGALLARWIELNNQIYRKLKGFQNQDFEAVIDGGKIPLALFLFHMISWNYLSSKNDKSEP